MAYQFVSWVTIRQLTMTMMEKVYLDSMGEESIEDVRYYTSTGDALRDASQATAAVHWTF